MDNLNRAKQSAFAMYREDIRKLRKALQHASKALREASSLADYYESEDKRFAKVREEIITVLKDTDHYA